MRSVKIVTYCTWRSIGSIMQTLGLKKALVELGYESVVWLPEDHLRYTKNRIRSVRGVAKRILDLPMEAKKKAAYRKSSRFIEQNIDIETYGTQEDLTEKARLDPHSRLLAGSDQIWHPDLCDPVFFLDFVENRKRISYAASMGKTIIEPDKKEEFQRLVRGFDSISVREEECAELIRGMTDREVSVHIDPTFLVDAEEWRRYEVEYPVRGHYILLYMIYWHPSCKEKIKKLQKQTGLPVYAITTSSSRVYADKCLMDVSPGEFLWLIDHADYVVTSSFHGVAFSTILNKRFAPVVNPAAASRIENLLRTLSIPRVSIEELADGSTFDYTAVNEAIRLEKERSMQYLKKVLE